MTLCVISFLILFSPLLFQMVFNRLLGWTGKKITGFHVLLCYASFSALLLFLILVFLVSQFGL